MGRGVTDSRSWRNTKDVTLPALLLPLSLQGVGGENTSIPGAPAHAHTRREVWLFAYKETVTALDCNRLKTVLRSPNPPLLFEKLSAADLERRPSTWPSCRTQSVVGAVLCTPPFGRIFCRLYLQPQALSHKTNDSGSSINHSPLLASWGNLLANLGTTHSMLSILQSPPGRHAPMSQIGPRQEEACISRQSGPPTSPVLHLAKLTPTQTALGLFASHT